VAAIPSFEEVAEAIPHIVWLAADDGSTDYFNERGTEYTGLPRQANYGWRWLELVHPHDTERAKVGWELATTTATPFELSYRIRRSDGQCRWHALRALPVRGESGNILRWLGTADDLGVSLDGLDDEARVQRQIQQLRTMLDVAQPHRSARFGYVRADDLTRRVNAALARHPRDAAESRRDDRARSLSVEGLTSRDVAVARLVANGYTNVEIANVLGYSLRTIESCRARLRRVLGLRTRSDIVRFARESGLDDGTT
jgi:PAS domain S-box-containing protein